MAINSDWKVTIVLRDGRTYEKSPAIEFNFMAIMVNFCYKTPAELNANVSKITFERLGS